jgi:hypothetical protein
MDGTKDTTKDPRQESTTRRPCLVDGCTCKDARIVSRRKAAYFAARAQANGQTADRVIAPQRGWRIPALTSPDPQA